MSKENVSKSPQETWEALVSATEGLRMAEESLDAARDDRDRAASEHEMALALSDGRPVWVEYTNWRGERGTRRIKQARLAHGLPWQPPSERMLEVLGGYEREPTDLVQAVDVAKGEKRSFVLSRIHRWSCAL